MTIIPFPPKYHNPDMLLTPKETIEYLFWRYGLNITLPSFYSMISRKQSPEVTRFRGRPKFKLQHVDAWVRNGGI